MLRKNRFLFIILLFAFDTARALGQRQVVQHACPPNQGVHLHVGNIDDGKKHVFTGNIAGLKIQGNVDSGSEVEVNALPGCRTVHITGKIDGRSVVSISVTGDVTIGEKIDGASAVGITTNGDVTIGPDRIDGASNVTVYRCRNFRVKGKIDNPNTQVSVNNTGTFRVDDGIKNGNVTHR
jgi:hypothetical protein